MRISGLKTYAIHSRGVDGFQAINAILEADAHIWLNTKVLSAFEITIRVRLAAFEILACENDVEKVVKLRTVSYTHLTLPTKA